MAPVVGKPRHRHGEGELRRLLEHGGQELQVLKLLVENFKGRGEKSDREWFGNMARAMPRSLLHLARIVYAERCRKDETLGGMGRGLDENAAITEDGVVLDTVSAEFVLVGMNARRMEIAHEVRGMATEILGEKAAGLKVNEIMRGTWGVEV